MISYETWCQIRDCRVRQHMTLAKIAERLHLHFRTVATWAVLSRYEARKSVKRTSKLDPFKGLMGRLIDTHQHDTHPFTAMKIFQRLCKEGYLGGYTTVQNYVRLIRPKKHQIRLKLAFSTEEATESPLNEVPNRRERPLKTYSLRIEYAIKQTLGGVNK
ncbi:hypothetical protein [Propionivibrio sp.]|uniref:hypothetical protein n=1 Tax=Propionivibrio sp. TaxID=2212460 RepID=UPI003BF0751F